MGFLPSRFLGLRQTSESGWYLERQVANRRHFAHAHALAYTAAARATQLSRGGCRVLCSVFEWRHAAHTSDFLVTLPAWSSGSLTRSFCELGLKRPLDPSPSEFMEPALTVAHPAPGPDGFRMLQAQMNHVRSRGRRTGSFSLRQVHRARQRHRIPKAALVDTLFKTLDTRNTGVWARNKLMYVALATGHQGELDDVFDDVSNILELGSSSTLSGSKAPNVQDFASLISRTGLLPLSKAELRRTIRFSEAPEMQGPLVRSGPGSWRSIRHMNIFVAAAQWKEGVCWHRISSPWANMPHHQCTDPDCPLKTHPHLFRRVGEAWGIP